MAVLRSYTTSGYAAGAISKPAGAIDGDLLIFFSSGFADRGNTPPGFTLISDDTSPIKTLMAYRIVASDTGTYALTSGTVALSVMHCYDSTKFSGTVTNGSLDEDFGLSTGVSGSSGNDSAISNPNGFAVYMLGMWFQAGGANGRLSTFSMDNTTGMTQDVIYADESQTYGTYIYTWEETSSPIRSFTWTGTGNAMKSQSFRWAPGIAPVHAGWDAWGMG